jgi:hypothetical protein
VDPITGEVVPYGALVEPVAAVANVVRALEKFETTSRAILRPTDWQTANDGRFVVRAGWRRLALAYALSDELVDRIVESDERGRFVRVTTMLRVVAPNGRQVTGVGVCAIKEKCGGRRPCPSSCDGFRHWTASDHVLSATSFTRALSRGISDLVGGGPADDELPDEDQAGMGGGHDNWETPAPSLTSTTADPPAPTTPETPTYSSELAGRVAALNADERWAFDAFIGSRNFPWPTDSPAVLRQVELWLDSRKTAATPVQA